MSYSNATALSGILLEPLVVGDTLTPTSLGTGWTLSGAGAVKMYRIGAIGFLRILYVTRSGGTDTMLTGIPAALRPPIDWPFVVQGGGVAVITATGTITSTATGGWSASCTYPIAP